MTGNAVVVNFSGGETSPRSRGRFDQPWYQTSAEKLLNFIPELQGPARFRPGFVFCRQTRGGATPRILPFQVNNNLAYMLEFTSGFMRVYLQSTLDLLTTTEATITGITKAAQGVITVASATGLANGKEVILSGIVGMAELNNRQVIIANLSGLTFKIKDAVTGAYIDTSGLTTYSSAGTAAVVYEIASPFLTSDLPNIQIATTGTLAYLVCAGQAPQKLSVDAGNNFTIGTYSRTNDPFGAQATDLTSFTAISLGTQTEIQWTGGAPVEGVIYDFSTFVGTTELNTGRYRLVVDHTPSAVYTAVLKNLDGSNVDSSAWTPFISGGLGEPEAENPISVGFYEGRLGFFGTNQRPDCLFLSRAPDNNGNSRYDDFTGGAAADYACFFQLAPTSGSTDYASWMRGGPDYLFLGTFGGPYRVSGSGLDIPITPASVNVRQFDDAGAAPSMAAGLSQMFFIQRGGVTIRAIKVLNPYLASFESADLCLNAEQIGYSELKRVVLQRGRPDSLWIYRDDGVLCNMSVHITQANSETLTGWAQHKIGGAGSVVDLGVTQRSGGMDQLWIVVQRTINGASRCYVEVMANDVYFPDPEDFFTKSGVIVSPNDDPSQENADSGDGSKAADLALWQNAVWRLQEEYVHMDSEAAYDGSLRGTTAGATLTPSSVGVPQVEGEDPTTITLVASAAVFTLADVGTEIWVKPSATTGAGAGRALITAFTSSTEVTATVSVPFSSVAAVAAGDWYFAVSTFYGFGHLEGADVAAVGDGAVISDGGQTGNSDFPTLTVTDGVVTLPAGDLGQQLRAAVLRVGLPYIGILETHNLEMGGRFGPAQAKPRNISEISIRFLSSLGVEYGTDLYAMRKIDHRLSDAILDRPAPVFSGLRLVNLEDSWSGLDDNVREKKVVVCQRLPLPAIVQALDLKYVTADDGGPE